MGMRCCHKRVIGQFFGIKKQPVHIKNDSIKISDIRGVV